uniref:Dimer_Tnp_hAT domain-containing protein n=1 Tax=Strongyloides venezuelensis TaxID=75913 RepID=A0A0K0FBB3_STRVS
MTALQSNHNVANRAAIKTRFKTALDNHWPELTTKYTDIENETSLNPFQKEISLFVRKKAAGEKNPDNTVVTQPVKQVTNEDAPKNISGCPYFTHMLESLRTKVGLPTGLATQILSGKIWTEYVNSVSDNFQSLKIVDSWALSNSRYERSLSTRDKHERYDVDIISLIDTNEVDLEDLSQIKFLLILVSGNTAAGEEFMKISVAYASERSSYDASYKRMTQVENFVLKSSLVNKYSIELPYIICSNNLENCESLAESVCFVSRSTDEKTLMADILVASASLINYYNTWFLPEEILYVVCPNISQNMVKSLFNQYYYDCHPSLTMKGGLLFNIFSTFLESRVN